MSYNDRPEYIAPDDQRCEALVKGQPTWGREWARHDHRCPKGAVQSRAGMVVCAVHGRSKTVIKWNSKNL